MTLKSQNPQQAGSYHMLRTLFVAGLGLGTLLWFVPALTIQAFGAEQTFSVFSLTRLVFQAGSVGAGMFLVSLFAFNIAFIVLALAHPRRWVFLVGASVMAFSALSSLFVGLPEGVTALLIPSLLSWVSTFLVIIPGFLIRPPVEEMAAVAQKFCTQCGARNSLSNRFCEECGSRCA